MVAARFDDHDFDQHLRGRTSIRVIAAWMSFEVRAIRANEQAVGARVRNDGEIAGECRRAAGGARDGLRKRRISRRRLNAAQLIAQRSLSAGALSRRRRGRTTC